MALESPGEAAPAVALLRGDASLTLVPCMPSAQPSHHPQLGESHRSTPQHHLSRQLLNRAQTCTGSKGDPRWDVSGMRISAAGQPPPCQQRAPEDTHHILATAKRTTLPACAKPWGLSPAPCNLLPSKRRLPTTSSTAQQQGPGCRHWDCCGHQDLQAAGERTDGDMAAATSYLPCKVAPSSRGGKSGKVTPARTPDHESNSAHPR